jgi:hypothetical protein
VPIIDTREQRETPGGTVTSAEIQRGDQRGIVRGIGTVAFIDIAVTGIMLAGVTTDTGGIVVGTADSGSDGSSSEARPGTRSRVRRQRLSSLFTAAHTIT